MKQLICNLAYFLIRLKFWEASVIWDLRKCQETKQAKTTADNRRKKEKTMIKKDAITAYQLKHEHEFLKKRVMTFRKRLTGFCDELDEKVPEYTGWFVLLKKSGEGWECLGFYNPDTSREEDAEPEWTVALPIPKPETVEEFSGW